MSFRVEYSSRALKQLKKMDQFDARVITTWVKNNLIDIDNPRSKGKALSANHSDEWRYRVGKYRLLCLIHDDVLLIEIITIGHRRDVYE